MRYEIVIPPGVLCCNTLELAIAASKTLSLSWGLTVINQVTGINETRHIISFKDGKEVHK